MIGTKWSLVFSPAKKASRIQTSGTVSKGPPVCPLTPLAAPVAVNKIYCMYYFSILAAIPNSNFMHEVICRRLKMLTIESRMTSILRRSFLRCPSLSLPLEISRSRPLLFHSPMGTGNVAISMIPYDRSMNIWNPFEKGHPHKGRQFPDFRSLRSLLLLSLSFLRLFDITGC